ncbi:MAG TPA: aldose epimerase family protein [Bacteroidales bacterium]|nr:aldose epimerase family protein [Bacteroidales bacterium]
MSILIEKLPFGKLPDGRTANLFRMTNESGAVAEVTNWGARLVRILVPNKDGVLTSVIKGYDNLDSFLTDTCYLGATCGRYANRIAKGKFLADGEEYNLVCNNGPNALHGGPNGFHIQIWDAKIERESLILSYLSKDGEEGYPGNLSVEVAFNWSETNELSMEVTANTDKATPINITNHAYFNLNGEGDILGHNLKINANRYIPIQKDAIPTGEIRLVEGTAFDFREAKPIGRDIEAGGEQLEAGAGYDHCYVLNKEEFADLVMAADAFAPESGIGLCVYTTMPGVQFYSGNYLGSEVPGLNGQMYDVRHAFCLEPEFFPDSPNQSGFPRAILYPEETFRQTMIFQFY